MGHWAKHGNWAVPLIWALYGLIWLAVWVDHYFDSSALCSGTSGGAECARSWLAATSGWIAAFAAAAAIPVFAMTLVHQRRSTERQLRAYLYVEEIGAKESPAGEKNVFLNIKNYGATPAYDIRLIFAWAIEKPGMDMSARSTGAEASYANWSDLPPAETRNSSAPINVDLAKWKAAIERGELVYYSYGHIKYRDVFGFQRSTWFQHQLIRDIDRLAFRLSSLGNRSD